MRKKILVAGATGYLGRHLVKELSERGYEIRVLVRNDSKLKVEGKAFAPTLQPYIQEHIVGDLTLPDSLDGICEGVDWVISTVSLMSQIGHQTWRDVDYQGNLNLLREAEKCDVERFVYASVFQAEKMRYNPMVAAHEDFVAELLKSPISHTVVRPTGFFSDLAEIWNLALDGRVYLFGDGSNRVNPIHGQDLANAIAHDLSDPSEELSVGGPATFSWNEIAKLAFTSLGRTPKITHIPKGLARAVVGIARPFVPKRAVLWDFFLTSASLEFVAERRGNHQLVDFFEKLTKLCGPHGSKITR